MTPEIQELLTNIGIGIFCILLSYILIGIKKVIGSIQNEYISKIKDENKRQLFSEALKQLNELVESTVVAMENNTAKELRQAVKEGNGDRLDLVKLSLRVSADVYKNMCPEYLKILEESVADLNQYVDTLIDSNVYKIKNRK